MDFKIYIFLFFKLFTVWNVKGSYPFSSYMFDKQYNTSEKQWAIINYSCKICLMFFVQHFSGNEYSCKLLVSHLKQANRQTNKHTKGQNGLTRILWFLPNSASIKYVIKKYKLQISLLMNLRLCSGPVKIDFVYTDLVALWDCLVACLSSLSRWNYLLSCTKSCWGIAMPCLASIYLMLCYCLKMKSIYF